MTAQTGRGGGLRHLPSAANVASDPGLTTLRSQQSMIQTTAKHRYRTFSESSAKPLNSHRTDAAEAKPGRSPVEPFLSQKGFNIQCFIKNVFTNRRLVYVYDNYPLLSCPLGLIDFFFTY